VTINEARQRLAEAVAELGFTNGDEHVIVNAILVQEPDVVLRALGGDAVLAWLENQDGFGFVVETIKAEAAR